MTQERITPLKITGIILGSAGSVIMIVYHGDITLDSDTFKGNLFALLNTLAYAVYLIMIKPIMNKYSSIAVMKWVFAFGVLFSVPISFKSMLSVSFANFNPSAWSALVFVIVATTFLAYLFTIYALKRVEASVVSFYIYLQPFIAALITAWMGVQAFTVSKVMAAIFIFTGVYLVSRKPKKIHEVNRLSQ
jgi:drug/metabolite transporter (DMT)-like permease